MTKDNVCHYSVWKRVHSNTAVIS